MFKNLRKSDSKGFTIVEVMFVLAIAAMIMLIVFLAVPALQRNARNASRKADAGRLVSAIANYISNNNGTLPTAANWAGTSCGQIKNDAGANAFGQFTTLTCTAPASAPAVPANNNDFDLWTIAANYTPPAQTTGGEVIYIPSATCDSSVPGQADTTTNNRNSVLLYDLETGSGNYNWTCVSAS